MRFGRSRKSGKTEKKPDGEVRQSQLIGAYGPGAMIDLVQHAVLVQGLESWRYDDNGKEHFIREPRLLDALVNKHHLELTDPHYFRLAPAGDGSEPDDHVGIRALEFPGWFVCQACRGLFSRYALAGTLTKSGRRHHVDCTKAKSPALVPVRFVGACTGGHLQDFPWALFAHHGKNPCSGMRLYLHEGEFGDFNDIEVGCRSCGSSQKLAAARSDRVTIRCEGKRPWLPYAEEDDPAGCPLGLRLLVRTASNGYFAMQMSAISMDEPAHGIRDALRGHEEELRKRAAKGQSAVRDFFEFKLEELVEKHGMEAVVAEALHVAKGATPVRAPIRQAEYAQLTTLAAPEKTGDVFDEDAMLVARKLERHRIPKVDAVTLVHRLREVVVQFGFTRLEPVSADMNGEFSPENLDVKRAPLSLEEGWLPAAMLRGEGVFFSLEAEALAEWEARDAVKLRAAELASGWTRWHENRQSHGKQRKVPPFLGARFYMLHSLSHLLIHSIAMECGYAASSIKERLYCGPIAGSSASMAGILLYTGTVGSEGTLGGLVAQGRRLRHHLGRALDTGLLCSNDPLCGAHGPHNDYSDRLLHGAACHGCLLIAETCCDKRFNQNLDRALVVPTLGHDEALAFFGSRDVDALRSGR